MFNNLKDMAGMFSQLKDVQKQFKKMQETMKNEKFTSEVGGGLVKATVNGQMRLVDLQLDTNSIKEDELNILPSLIKNAITQAQEKAQDYLKSNFGDSVNMPNLPNIFG